MRKISDVAFILEGCQPSLDRVLLIILSNEQERTYSCFTHDQVRYFDCFSIRATEDIQFEDQCSARLREPSFDSSNEPRFQYNLDTDESHIPYVEPLPGQCPSDPAGDTTIHNSPEGSEVRTAMLEWFGLLSQYKNDPY